MAEWQPIETAPRDGTCFKGRAKRVNPRTGCKNQLVRKTWYGKVSHVPIYGWCHGRCEDVDLWEPTHWMHLPFQSVSE